MSNVIDTFGKRAECLLTTNSEGNRRSPEEFDKGGESLSPDKIVKDKEEIWYCYILRNKQYQYSKLTYNGSTNNPKRRLRQHNEEITGGAKFTHGKGGGWEIYALLSGFPDHKNTLSCEWRIKHPNGKPGKRDPRHCGVLGRVMALNDIFTLDKWTKPCFHDNRNLSLTLYLAEDVVSCVDIFNLPSYVTYGGNIPELFK
jgi:predicted GIY-YIG superfamily endonuclease